MTVNASRALVPLCQSIAMTPRYPTRAQGRIRKMMDIRKQAFENRKWESLGNFGILLPEIRDHIVCKLPLKECFSVMRIFWMASLGEPVVLRNIDAQKLAQYINVNHSALHEFGFSKQDLSALLPHIEYLSSYRRNITAVELNTCHNLTHLDLGFNNNAVFSDELIQCLLKFKGLKRLLGVNVWGNTEAGIRPLGTFENLQSLSLTFYSFEELTQTILKEIARIKTLKWLYLQNCCDLTDEGFKTLTKMKGLVSLHVFSCHKVTKIGFQNLRKLHKLNSFGISSNFLRNDWLELLGKMENLTSLNIPGCFHLTDMGLEHFGNLTNLKTLELKRCAQLTDGGLASLKGLTELRTLSLEGCTNIRGTGFQHLTVLQNVKHLSLVENTTLTNDGLVHVAQLTNLESLNLKCCHEVADRGISYIRSLQKLKTLNLADCHLLSDRSLEVLSEMTSLAILNLNWCRLVTKRKALELFTRLENLVLTCEDERLNAADPRIGDGNL